MQDLSTPLIPKVQDNRAIALIFMNLFCTTRALVSVIFKIINLKGVTVTEFLFWKYIGNLIFSVAVLATDRINPFKQPKSVWLIYRVIFGISQFFLMIYSLSLLPVMLHMIVSQTAPFWVSVLDFAINKERLTLIEGVAMALCLSGVAMIALSKND